ncbi:unnamed protein product [Choristocarpus tenellus]
MYPAALLNPLTPNSSPINHAFPPAGLYVCPPPLGVPLFLPTLVHNTQEEFIRHAGAGRARGAEGSGLGERSRRRSRSFGGVSGSSSPRVMGSPSTSSSTRGAKRKRSDSTSGGDAIAVATSVARLGAGAGEEAIPQVARPAIAFCRMVDALQTALKGNLSGDGGAASEPVEVFTKCGDEVLLGASRAAQAALESTLAAPGAGGGIDECFEALGIRGEILGKGARSCRERVVELLSEGELQGLAALRE